MRTQLLAKLIVVLSVFASELAAQTIPSTVTSALSKYEILNPVTFHWEEDTGGPSPMIITYARQNDRFAYSRERPSDDVFYSYRFDGVVLASVHNKSDASRYEIDKLVKTQPKSIQFRVPYFEAAGIFYAHQHEDYKGSVLKSNVLYLLENGGTLVSCEKSDGLMRIEIIADNPKYEEVAGRLKGELEYQRNQLDVKLITQQEYDRNVKAREDRIASLPKSLHYVYHLSPEHQFAVRKHARVTSTGKTVVAYTNSDFQRLSGTDLMVPHRVDVSSYVYFGADGLKVLESPNTAKVSISKFSVDEIPTDEFSLQPAEVAAGATVIDAANTDLVREDGSVITFEMPASPDELDAAAANAAGRRGFGGLGRVLLVVNCILVVVLIGYIIKRRQSQVAS